jgi:hypothetical protein
MVAQRAPEELCRDVERLVFAWCDRRCFRALRAILQGWPLSSGLTDDWGALLDALEKVRAFASAELTEGERAVLEELIHAAGKVVYRT